MFHRSTVNEYCDGAIIDGDDTIVNIIPKQYLMKEGQLDNIILSNAISTITCIDISFFIHKKPKSQSYDLYISIMFQ